MKHRNPVSRSSQSSRFASLVRKHSPGKTPHLTEGKIDILGQMGKEDEDDLRALFPRLHREAFSLPDRITEETADLVASLSEEIQTVLRRNPRTGNIAWSASAARGRDREYSLEVLHHLGAEDLFKEHERASGRGIGSFTVHVGSFRGRTELVTIKLLLDNDLHSVHLSVVWKRRDRWVGIGELSVGESNA